MANPTVTTAAIRPCLGSRGADVTATYALDAYREGRWHAAAVSISPRFVFVTVPTAVETVVAFPRETARFDAGAPFPGSPARLGDGTATVALRGPARSRLDVHEALTPTEPAPFTVAEIPTRLYVARAAGGSIGAAITAFIWLAFAIVVGLVAVSAATTATGAHKFVLFTQTTVTVGGLGVVIVAAFDRLLKAG